MTYKDILAPVIALEEDEGVLAAAEELAIKFDAKAIALIVAVHLSSEFADVERPLSAVIDDILKGARSHASLLREGIIAWLHRAQHAFEVRDITIEEAVHRDKVVAQARTTDLTVMGRASAHDRARRMLIEDVLLKSGKPLLVLPERPIRRRKWERVIIGWNETAEAARAVSGAMPFLHQARHVVIATVDAAPPVTGSSELPGRDLAAHLARHGVRAEVCNLDGLGRSTAKAILDQALAIDAELIVLGAYGHSRAREFVFGGVTREMLASSPAPLLLSH